MRLRLLLPLLFFVLGILLVDAKAQSYGYSYIEPYHPAPSASTRIYAETGTVLDYNTWYYYDPGIQGYLYEDSSLIASTDRIMNYNGPTVLVYTYPDPEARYGSTYTLHGDHYLGSYYYYYSGGQPYYYDPFGYSFYSGSYPSPYSFLQGPAVYYTYQIYKVASTQVSIQATEPLHLDSIDTSGGAPGATFLTTLRGTGLFGTGNGQGASQTVQVSGSGVTATVQSTSPNTIEVLDVNIEIAPDAAVGERTLTLTVNGQTSNSIPFRIGDRTPQITNITPPEGNMGDQVEIAISGSGFGFNPLIQIDGTGVSPTITSSTTTDITAIFSVADATYIGTRGVKIVSRGITGNGFMQTPGNSDTSSSVGFEVTANPSVEIPDIGSIEKGTVRPVDVVIRNLPVGQVAKFTFKDQPLPASPTKPAGGWDTGEARFDDGSPNGLRVISFQGTGEAQVTRQVSIRGWERSTSKNNIKLEARFNSDTNVKKSKEFTVSSVEFVEENECTGYDDVEFQQTNSYGERYLYVPNGSSNKFKAKVVPSGSTGTFNLEPTGMGISISPSVINSTNIQVVTVTATATATDLSSINIKANNSNPSTNSAELVGVNVLTRKNKNVVIYAVTEDNDDISTRTKPTSPDSICITSGPNQLLDTVPNSNDVERLDPTGLTSLMVITAGANLKCDTRGANSTDIPPPTIPNLVSLENYLNNTTWERQSNIHFTVTLGTPFEVNFDKNRDGKLERPDQTVPSSYQEIDTIKANQNPPIDTINLYYVGTEFSVATVRGLTFLNYQHAWFSPESLTNSGANLTVAHEIGHAIGNPHTSEDITATQYQPDLMYFGYLNGTINQCRIRKPQWDKARLLP